MDEINKNGGGAGLSIASMILGIVSILFPCGLLGLIFAAVALKKANAGKGMAVAGLVLCIISLALAVVTIIMGGAILGSLGLM